MDTGVKTAAVPGRHCKRPPADTPREVRNMGHKAKMLLKRQLRRSGLLQAGFKPSPNKRINQAIQARAILFLAEAETNSPGSMTQMEAHDAAVRSVARDLPKARPFRHLFPRPSKNDSAAYRKQTGDRRFVAI